MCNSDSEIGIGIRFQWFSELNWRLKALESEWNQTNIFRGGIEIRIELSIFGPESELNGNCTSLLWMQLIVSQRLARKRFANCPFVRPSESCPTRHAYSFGIAGPPEHIWLLVNRCWSRTVDRWGQLAILRLSQTINSLVRILVQKTSNGGMLHIHTSNFSNGSA